LFVWCLSRFYLRFVQNEFLDDDETDRLHEVELPLSLYGQGEMSKYHESTFTCIVTYKVANDQGELEDEKRSAPFGTIKIKRKKNKHNLKIVCRTPRNFRVGCPGRKNRKIGIMSFRFGILCKIVYSIE